MAGSVFGVVLAVGGGGGRFDVAAAVVRAIKPGNGVRYVSLETRYSGHSGVSYFQYWSTAHPRRERKLVRVVEGGRARMLEGTIAAGGAWTYWSTTGGRAGSILHTSSTRAEPLFDATLIQKAYRRREMRLAGRTKLEGQDAFRLEIVHPGDEHAPPVEVLVAARTFVPIEIVNYTRARDGRLRKGWVTRYSAYEELPPTPSSLALLRMASHPRATQLR